VTSLAHRLIPATHHRATPLRHVKFLDDAIATCDGRIATCTAAEADAVACLDTIPGVARRTAETIVAELGCDMSRFPTAGHAASWGASAPVTTRVPASA
jgi:transposase